MSVSSVSLVVEPASFAVVCFLKRIVLWTHVLWGGGGASMRGDGSGGRDRIDPPTTNLITYNTATHQGKVAQAVWVT